MWSFTLACVCGDLRPFLYSLSVSTYANLSVAVCKMSALHFSWNPDTNKWPESIIFQPLPALIVRSRNAGEREHTSLRKCTHTRWGPCHSLLFLSMISRSTIGQFNHTYMRCQSLMTLMTLTFKQS